MVEHDVIMDNPWLAQKSINETPLRFSQGGCSSQSRSSTLAHECVEVSL